MKFWLPLLMLLLLLQIPTAVHSGEPAAMESDPPQHEEFILEEELFAQEEEMVYVSAKDLRDSLKRLESLSKEIEALRAELARDKSGVSGERPFRDPDEDEPDPDPLGMLSNSSTRTLLYFSFLATVLAIRWLLVRASF